MEFINYTAIANTFFYWLLGAGGVNRISILYQPTI